MPGTALRFGLPLVAAFACASALAAGYPEKVVTLVVPLSLIHI